MDNAQKAIMIGVGLFITIIIISAVLLIVNLGTGLVDDATAELGTMSTSLQNQITQNYDNKTLSGVQVRAAIQQYLSSADTTVVLMKTGGTDIAATVGAKKITANVSKSGEFYTVTSGEYTSPTVGSTVLARTSMTDFNDVNKAGDGIYVNTSSNYSSYLLKVAGTSTVVGIVFVPAA